ncbi:MAG: sulfoxide reductase heme-binding subunit YedZ [Proteobacteria bacterium]|nr:sulfoxide reductase heme-binding subunit YedZ [Pseudomonadota bacterium]
MIPWTDRSGRFSPFKLAILVALLLPGLYIGIGLATGTLGAKPIEVATHEIGLWTIRFLMITLAVTPLRVIAGWRRLIHVRRMLGVATFCYALIHLSLYVADQKFNLGRVASEIAVRFYLTIGFAGLVGLAMLAATSTDGAIRKLGKKWTLLHKAVYVIAMLGLAHFFIQSKIDVSEATVMAGIFVLLMAYRLAKRVKLKLTPGALTVIAVGIAALTAGLEVVWYASATGVDPARILQANLDFSFMVRPTWWVLGTGLAVVLVALVKGIDWSRLKRAPLEAAS